MAKPCAWYIIPNTDVRNNPNYIFLWYKHVEPSYLDSMIFHLAIEQLGYYSLILDVGSIFFKTNLVLDRTHDHFRQLQAKQS